MFISVYIFNMVNLNACMSDLAKIYRILRMGLKMDSHFKMHSVLIEIRQQSLVAILKNPDNWQSLDTGQLNL